MTIFPGETEIHEFLIPFSAVLFQKAVASYKQCNYITLEATSTNFIVVDANSCKVRFVLTQEQTLQLRNTPRCQVQLNLFSVNNERITSVPITLEVGEQFCKKVIQ